MIQQAQFNPRIKSYFLLLIALYIVISVIGIPLLLFWFLGIGQYISRRYYQNLICRLTERHLEFKKGVMFKVEKTIPLENIQDLTFIDNPLLRIFDLRILKIETAGQSNPQGGDMELIGIIDTYAFKDMVLQQREILLSGMDKSSHQSFPENASSLALLTEIRDLLKELINKNQTL
jgi:putative membrane protein